MLTRIAKSRLFAGTVGAAVAVAALSATTVLADHDPNTIHACVSISGKIRIVEAAALCQGKEQPLTWNEQGVQGEPGVGLPENCTSGQVAKSDGTTWICGEPAVGLPENCTSGQVAKSDGTTWICGEPAVGLPENCTSGQVAKSDGTNWICGTDLG